MGGIEPGRTLSFIDGDWRNRRIFWTPTRDLSADTVLSIKGSDIYRVRSISELTFMRADVVDKARRCREMRTRRHAHLGDLFMSEPIRLWIKPGILNLEPPPRVSVGSTEMSEYFELMVDVVFQGIQGFDASLPVSDDPLGHSGTLERAGSPKLYIPSSLPGVSCSKIRRMIMEDPDGEIDYRDVRVQVVQSIGLPVCVNPL